MQFDTMPNGMNMNNDANTDRPRPRLIKKSNLSTQKVVDNNVAPSASSPIGYDFSVGGTSSNNIEEKVAHLSLQMNQIIVKPYLQQALDYLKTSKKDSINAYNQLSDQIANEIRIISQNTQQISNSLKEAQDVVAKTQEIIRNKYNNAIEEEISSGSLNLEYEYNIVAEHYELSLQLTQELSRYKSRIDSLLSTQAMLDESIVPAISRLQLEIDNLELLLHSFDSSNYADILAKKTGVNISTKNVTSNDFRTRSEELNKMVAASSINSINTFENQNNVNLNNMNRYEAPNQQRIDTNNYQYQQQAFNNVNTFNNTNTSVNTNNSSSSMYNNNSNMNYSMNNNQQFNNANTTTNFKQSSNIQETPGMSRQELRMIKKLREQQMKFEHMMRMNELIFEYNKSIDQMILKQREYELAHQEQFADAKRANNSIDRREAELSGSKHIYETKMPLETVDENIRKSNTDKIFVVRQADPVTEDQARELKNRGAVKSIRVVKK